MKQYAFPDHFFWGVSTAAAQVETAFQHQWKGFKSLDGHSFERTTDHELRRGEDLGYIVPFGSVYRCSVDWSRLQPKPYVKFDKEVVQEYRAFFSGLKEHGTGLMLVLHHFAHPQWFEARGGWTNEDNIPLFLDFARRCIKHFGEFVLYWNTFNEPNVYALNAFLLGNFPPRKKRRYFTANRVLDNMGRAHDIVFRMIREKSKAPIGISLNTAWFEGLNLPGKAVAALVRYWFMKRAARPFEKCDFWGLSYYAYMPFDPLPMDAISRKKELEKRGIPHDRMWGYRPEGLGKMLKQFHQKYGKPVIVTENGVCTDDPDFRIRAIQDYLIQCHQAIQAGVPVLGYIHWSAWDNFEWHLGPTYRFGLVAVDPATKDRQMTEAGIFYRQVVKDRGFSVENTG